MGRPWVYGVVSWIAYRLPMSLWSWPTGHPWVTARHIYGFIILLVQHGSPMSRSWVAHVLPTDCPRIAHGLSMGRPRLDRATPQVAHGSHHGLVVLGPWVAHRYHMGIPRVCNAGPWVTHGSITLGSLLDHLPTPWGFIAKAMGRPWVTPGSLMGLECWPTGRPRVHSSVLVRGPPTDSYYSPFHGQPMGLYNEWVFHESVGHVSSCY